MGSRSAAMSHREVLTALSGLLMAMFVALLSSTVVASSLPHIVSDLGGTQASYTWIVTATLLAMTVTTPIWGKLADLFARKRLLQIAIATFTAGSILAGLSPSPEFLIACRVIQGVGVGGIMALVQVVMSDIVSPRERGRYMGFLGAVTAIPTIAGPLLGGVITDTIGWRWNFYVAVPVAVVALIVLQRTLHLPTRRREVSIDYLGTVLIASSVSTFLIWISLGGSSFAWTSGTSIVMFVGSLTLMVLAIVVEQRATDPMLPLHLFRNRTIVVAIVAVMAVGVVMVSTSVFLSQYMQLARGKTPTESGLLTIPMMLGTLIASVIVGRLITRTGVWKPYVVAGTVLLFLGALTMGTIRYDTNLVQVGVGMVLLGLGVGMTQQNLLLVVQNSVDFREMGSASGLIAFFRTLGGAVGVAALGAVAAHRVTSYVTQSVHDAGIKLSGAGASGTIPDVRNMEDPMRTIVESSYGHAIGDVFLFAAPILLIAVVAAVLLPNAPLGTKSGIEQAEQAGLEAADALEVEAESGLPTIPADEVNALIGADDGHERPERGDRELEPVSGR